MTAKEVFNRTLYVVGYLAATVIGIGYFMFLRDGLHLNYIVAAIIAIATPALLGYVFRLYKGRKDPDLIPFDKNLMRRR